MVAPVRGSVVGSPWCGNLERKPWEYAVTAVIPVLDTPDQLAVCVEVLRAQTERPYILVIDTGSLPANLATIETMRAEDLEVHQVRSHGWRHPSEPVAVACQLGQDLARTEFVFHTHSDCFLMRAELLAEWMELARRHAVVGYQISPRPYPGWETELGHTALMMHLPTIRKARVSWNMAAFVERQIVCLPHDSSLELGPNRPDTESEMNACLAAAKIKPLMLGTEKNRERNTNEHFDHCRSFCVSKLFDGEYHAQMAVQMEVAMREARDRVTAWTTSPAAKTAERGIVYVAWGEKHVLEAARSAATSRYPTALVTCSPQFVPAGAFGEVIVEEFRDFAGLHPFYRKLAGLRRSPFAVTVFLDADTAVVGADLDLGFRQAEKFGFAAVISPGMTFELKGVEYVHYNGGVLFVRGCPDAWIAEVLRLAPEFPRSDEPAWAVAWDRLGINPAVLPFSFNAVMAAWVHPRPVRIWHSRLPPQTHIVSLYPDPNDRPAGGVGDVEEQPV